MKSQYYKKNLKSWNCPIYNKMG